MRTSLVVAALLTVTCSFKLINAFSQTGWFAQSMTKVTRGAPCPMSMASFEEDHAGETLSRRSAIGRSLSSAAALSTILSTANPAHAKEKEAITPENVKAAFSAVRFELEDPAGGVADLESRISAKDWEGVLEFTRTYDLEFRKAKMGRARKLLTDKKVKEDSVLKSNAVTFDLIGINRASRDGKENQEEAMKYLGELKDDIRKFLELESTVDFSAVEGS